MTSPNQLKEQNISDSNQNKHIIKLAECISVCSSCAKRCLQEGNIQASTLCSDCADVCTLAIKFHSRNSEFADEILNLASKICKRCSEECGKLKTEHAQHCSKVCRECTECCK